MCWPAHKFSLGVLTLSSPAADKLRDLDDRLTKAFASKLGCAIFSALQDVRHATTKIQTTLDGLPENLEAVCRDATREGIQEAIVALKEEAYQATGGGQGREKGFANGEAEKLISQVTLTSSDTFPSLILITCAARRPAVGARSAQGGRGGGAECTGCLTRVLAIPLFSSTRPSSLSLVLRPSRALHARFSLSLFLDFLRLPTKAIYISRLQVHVHLVGPAFLRGRIVALHSWDGGLRRQRDEHRAD